MRLRPSLRAINCEERNGPMRIATSARSSIRSMTWSVMVMSSCTSGCRAVNFGTSGSRWCTPNGTLELTRRRPRGTAQALTERSASSRSASTRSARSWKLRPSAVSCSLRVERLISREPRRASSRATSLLTADGVMLSALAAAVKPPCSTTRTKTSISPERLMSERAICALTSQVKFLHPI